MDPRGRRRRRTATRRRPVRCSPAVKQGHKVCLILIFIVGGSELIDRPQANLNNPNTGEESKQHSRQVVDQE